MTNSVTKFLQSPVTIVRSSGTPILMILSKNLLLTVISAVLYFLQCFKMVHSHYYSYHISTNIKNTKLKRIIMILAFYNYTKVLVKSFVNLYIFQ